VAGRARAAAVAGGGAQRHPRRARPPSGCAHARRALPRARLRPRASAQARGEVVQRIALAFTAFAERWIPDAFVFALLATVIVFVAGLGAGAAPSELVNAWGGGFWELLTFTLQMALVIITGYVIASAPPVKRLIRFVAARPHSAKGAVALVAVFAMLSSW